MHAKPKQCHFSLARQGRSHAMRHRTRILSLIFMAMGCGAEMAPPADSTKGSAQHDSPAPVAQSLPDLTEGAFRATGLPDNRTGRAIFAYLRAAFTPPKGGTSELAQAMRALKQNPVEVL